MDVGWPLRVIGAARAEAIVVAGGYEDRNGRDFGEVAVDERDRFRSGGFVVEEVSGNEDEVRFSIHCKGAPSSETGT